MVFVWCRREIKKKKEKKNTEVKKKIDKKLKQNNVNNKDCVCFISAF